MEILEIVGESITAHDPVLKKALRQMEHAVKAREARKTTPQEKQRIRDIIALCFEFDREADPEEKRNIANTLRELVLNEPIELPDVTLAEWEDHHAGSNPNYAKLRHQAGERHAAFLRAYAKFKAQAGYRTQAEVAAAAGLHRTQVSAIESGKHIPQQQTRQKLANAFKIDVSELIH
jgi:DNA-binding XRE family transcriptional regulator